MSIRYPVKWYSSEMKGAPEVTSATSIIDVLKKTLIEGFGLTAVNSITYNADTKLATITVNEGHGQLVDAVIQVAGADDDAYNGEHRALEVTNSTIKFKPPVAPMNTTASGEQLTVRTAPVGGWEITHQEGEGADASAIFRSTNPLAGYGGLRIGPRLTGNKAHEANLVYAETSIMDYIDRSGRFEVDSLYEQRWQLVADDAAFYLSRDGATWVFGDINSVLAEDKDCTVLCGYGNSKSDGRTSTYAQSTLPVDDYVTLNESTNSYHNSSPWLSSYFFTVIGRSFCGADNITNAVVNFPITNASSLISEINPADGKFYLSLDPLAVHEKMPSSNYKYALRGYLPGIYPTKHFGHARHGSTIRNVDGQPTKIFKLISLQRGVEINERYNPALCAAIDIVGPWR